MTTPTMRQLDIFAQMIASGSIDDCAREIGIRAADVERAIKALEDRLGHRLFDRIGGLFSLTTAGHTTAKAMQRLSEVAPERWQDEESGAEPAPLPLAFAALPKADAQEPESKPEPFRKNSRVARQAIVIATHPAIFSHFQDALSAFEETNSDVAITLDLDTHNATQAIPLLASGKADIAYFYALGTPHGWPSQYAWSEQLSLYIGYAHPLAAQEIVTREEMIDIAPVMLLPGNSLRPLIDAALAIARVPTPDPVLETDNLYDIMVAVRDGVGYFAAFGPLARDFSRMKGIRRLPLDLPLPAIDVRQATRAAVEDGSSLAVLSEYLFR